MVCLGLTATTALAQNANTPESAAKGFAKAYYMLDAAIFFT